VKGAIKQLGELDGALQSWIIDHRWDPLNSPMAALSAAGRHARLWVVIGRWFRPDRTTERTGFLRPVGVPGGGLGDQRSYAEATRTPEAALPS